MRAILMKEPGQPEVLVMKMVASPAPGPGQILIDVKATALNRADLLQRRGHYPPPPGVREDILGLEYAGVVARIGPEVTRWQEGDRVMGLVAGGAYAEQVVVHEREAIAIPPNMSAAQAAAIPEAFFTAYDALFVQGRLKVGDHVLIHAAGSGVGSAAIQIAKAAGAYTIGTGRTAWKLKCCRDLGLDESIMVEKRSFAEQYDRLESTRPPQVILDLVGGAYFEQNLQVIAENGTLVVVGLMGGPVSEINLGRLMQKRISVVGVVMRKRPLEEKIELAQAVQTQLLPLFSEGVLRPVVDRVLPIVQVVEAHHVMERGENFGKIILTWDE